MDEGIISTFSTELAKRLNKPNTKKFTAKSFCRLACTQLIEASISIISFCEAGNWKSAETAQEYTEYSVISTENRISMLDGKKRFAEKSEHADIVRAPSKQLHVLKTATVTTKGSSSITRNTNNSYTIISINANTVIDVAAMLQATEVPLARKNN